MDCSNQLCCICFSAGQDDSLLPLASLDQHLLKCYHLLTQADNKQFVPKECSRRRICLQCSGSLHFVADFHDTCVRSCSIWSECCSGIHADDIQECVSTVDPNVSCLVESSTCNSLKLIKQIKLEHDEIIIKDEDDIEEDELHDEITIKDEDDFEDELHDEIIIKDEDDFEEDDVNPSEKEAPNTRPDSDYVSTEATGEQHCHQNTRHIDGDRGRLPDEKNDVSEKSLELRPRENVIEKPFKCELCDKTFTHQRSLIRHKVIHTNERPFQCKWCDKSFNYHFRFVLHTRIHTGEKPFKCELCDKAFHEQSCLFKHKRRVHSKPFKCEMCPKAFSEETDLVGHTRKHTGEKPFKCNVCDKAFDFNTHLIRHARIHTGEKPYECATCGKCFAEKYQLVVHTRTHTGERPYKCEICKTTFNIQSHLTRHKRRKHKNVKA